MVPHIRAHANERKEGRKDGWKDGWMDGWMNGSLFCFFFFVEFTLLKTKISTHKKKTLSPSKLDGWMEG
jgi:hypothetical protein